MNTKRQPRQPWLEWAQRLQAIAQTGLTFTENPFKVERYELVREIAAEMMAAQSEWAAQPILDLFADQAGYATPKVDVRGVLFDADGRLLLVQERRDGGWTLPGGWADVNDSPAEATEREIFEESGYRARAVKLLACYDRNRHDHPRALARRPRSTSTSGSRCSFCASWRAARPSRALRPRTLAFFLRTRSPHSLCPGPHQPRSHVFSSTIAIPSGLPISIDA